MGVFDEIVLEKSIICKDCKSEINIIQTKQFDPMMERYELGDFVPHVLDTIIKEEFFCLKCRKDIGNIYFGIKDSVVLAIDEDLDKVRYKLKNISENDLLSILRKKSQSKKDITRKFYHIRNDIYHLKSYYENNFKGINKKGLIFIEMFSEYFRNHNIIENLEKILNDNIIKEKEDKMF